VAALAAPAEPGDERSVAVGEPAECGPLGVITNRRVSLFGVSCNVARSAADQLEMPAPAWIHLTARVSSADAPPLTRHDTAQWLWDRMRNAFPLAIAVMLMPDHPHLVVPSDDPEASRQRLARLLGQWGRRFGVRGQLGHVPAPQPIRGGQVLARQVRYVALNPCRRGLTRCPLAWPWSTHRDVVGAIVDPWVSARRMIGALATSEHDFVARHHAYVSGDPHASVAGTRMPVPAAPTTVARFPLDSIARAVLAATRSPAHALTLRGPTRSLFIALAVEQGWAHAADLARISGCSSQTVRRLAHDVDPVGLAAVRLCLGDARLRLTRVGSMKEAHSTQVKASPGADERFAFTQDE
jgi:hypothetical protein